MVGEAGLELHSRPGMDENIGVAAVFFGGKQMSTGHLHHIGSSPFLTKQKRHPIGCLFLVGEAGLEPARPQ